MAPRTFLKSPKRLEKLSQQDQISLAFDLIHAFALANDPLSASQLLQDLLTSSEIKNLSKRLRIAKLLVQGEKYRTICQQLHCGQTTVAKISVWLEESGEGFKKILSKLPKLKQKRFLKKGYYGYGLPQIILTAYASATANKQIEKVSTMLNTAKIKTNIYQTIEKESSTQSK